MDDGNDLRDLHPCQAAACTRLVGALSRYCCAPCAEASQGGFEIDAHSFGCEQRQKERRNAGA